MQISQKGLDLIKLEEGFRSYIYKDIAGLETIGFGHKILPTDNFPDGITLLEGCDLLLEDCHHLEFFLNALLAHTNTSLNQNQFDALMDFGFNLGAGSLHKLLSHGIANIPTQILLWDHSAGKVIEGLLERRKKELSLWLSPATENSQKSTSDTS